VFAFEEYGVQDGSGFPYANRFYIDVDTDSFIVADSPIRVRIDDEDAGSPLPGPRQDGGRMIVPMQNSKKLAASSPGSTQSPNCRPIRSISVVNPLPIFPIIDPPLEIRLEEIPFCSKASALSWTTAPRASALHEDRAATSD
jgi:predicted secreted protein